jgi:hypothetical protein
MLPLASNLSSARRVYASCSCCWPHAGQVEKKDTGLVMGADPFPKAAIGDASSLTHSWDSSPMRFFWRVAYPCLTYLSTTLDLLRPILRDNARPGLRHCHDCGGQISCRGARRVLKVLAHMLEHGDVDESHRTIERQGRQIRVIQGLRPRKGPAPSLAPGARFSCMTITTGPTWITEQAGLTQHGIQL